MKPNLKTAKETFLPLIARDSTILRTHCLLAEQWFENFTKKLQQLWDSGKIYELSADELHKEIFGE